MSDQSANILSALFLVGERDRQAQNAEQDHARERDALQSENADLQFSFDRLNSSSNEMEGEIATLIRHKQYLLEEFAKERNYRNEVVDMHNTLFDKHAALEKSHAQLLALLSKPLEDIALAQPAFRGRYEQQMMLLCKWMISQKAFKALAIEYGLEKGLSVDEVIAAGNLKKMDVLNNVYPEDYGSNAKGVSLLETRVEKFKLEHQSQISSNN